MNLRTLARSPTARLAVIGLGAATGPLDFSVTVAFPAITAAFELQPSDIRWLAVWYVIGYGSLMLAFGALGDRIGHLRVFRIGLALNALSCALTAFVPNYDWLMATRVLQGVAVALTLSCGPALAIAQFDERSRTRALSGYATIAALAAVVAPVLGGAAVAAMGWLGVFLFRVPIGLLAIACLPLLGPAAAMPHARAPAPFDTLGSLMLSASAALLLLLPALLNPAQISPLAAPIAVTGTLLMALFVRRQRASATPFLPHEVVQDGGFVVANLSNVVAQFATFVVPLTVPFYLARTADAGAAAIGAVLAVWAGGSMLGSSIAATVARRFGPRRTAFGAAMLVIIGLVAIAGWPSVPHYPLMVSCLLVQGVGIGLFQVAYTDLVVAALPPSARGVAGSLTMVTRTAGIVVGASVWIWTLQGLESTGIAAGMPARDAFVHAYDRVFLIAAAVAAAFFALTWRRWRD